ncbi:DUF1330 domain-containing protein [Octadecabacter ascidiaceicola]|uniref:DUF1330 domain-containing protein n=1 Tax=Octadecabacter ascidiaceicola TaxID=1655543 RepID=A0A238KK14_9RHOB|nr:DUF1330 domain-containing protein [Octadecabacter ascidiaceicola]SMX42442.1 hypothetical protein OCA8868_02740 [Octadecabacter ascidiaceicola]
MAKGYWIAFVTVSDPEAYAGYQSLAPEAFAKYGARFLVRGGDATPLEGEDWQRHVIIEFESKAQALACYNSPEYQAARSHRSGACTANIVIVDGMPVT